MPVYRSLGVAIADPASNAAATMRTFDSVAAANREAIEALIADGYSRDAAWEIVLKLTAPAKVV